MKPVLFTFFGQPISSLGLFLILAFLLSTFIIWRIIRAYELDEEKTIDLVLLSFLGGLVGARLYYLAFHYDQFTNFFQVIMVNKYPGLSFWGGLIGGLFTLWFFSRRVKLPFYQVADIAIVALWAGIAMVSLGCLFGGCQYGVPSNLPFAVSQVGIIGKRFPLQIIESVIFLIGFLFLWKRVLRFHFRGKIFAVGLMTLGGVKLVLEFFRGDQQILFYGVSAGMLLSLSSFVLGLTIFYSQGKRSLRKDMGYILSLFYNPNRRNLLGLKIRRNWYNLMVDLKYRRQRVRKGFLKSINVRSNPTEFK